MYLYAVFQQCYICHLKRNSEDESCSPGSFQLGSSYHFCQQGAAGICHEGMSEVDLSTVHLELHITELRVVHHAAQV